MPEKQKTNQRGSGRKAALCKQCLKKKKFDKQSNKIKIPTLAALGVSK